MRFGVVVLAKSARGDFEAMLPLMVLIGIFAVLIVPFIVAKQLKDTSIRRRLRRFFGRKYRNHPVVNRPFSILDTPNVRRAVEAFAESIQGTLETLTVNGGSLQSEKLSPGSARYHQMDIDVDAREECLTNPLYLVESIDQKVAILIHGVFDGGRPTVEVMAVSREVAGDCIQALRRLMREHSIYRGKIISIEGRGNAMDDYERGQSGSFIKFHRLPPVTGDSIILPPDTMQRIERNTVGFFRNVLRLKQQGHSAKRGLLFHGPPGTGKTRTACWLTHSLPNVTVFLVTGEQLWNIKESCDFARELAPAILILEDVDLIATRRDQSVQTTALHQLMNEMDGLDSDAEILFLLTTNQPDQIEPALANRPGRIDQAIHFPVPDKDCRRRLIELYRGKSQLSIHNWNGLLDRTSGSSPAFIKELVRKAALFAVEEMETDEQVMELSDRHFELAIQEMTLGDGALTRRLTGFAPISSESS